MSTLAETEEITVIDLANFKPKLLLQEPSPDILKISNDIKNAMTNSGLVILVNHGISQQEMQQAFSLFKQFLDLPEDVKEIYKFHGAKDNHGYLAQNTESFYNKAKKEIRESFNITHTDRKFPNNEVPGFSDCMVDLFDKFTDIANIFLQLLAIGLEKTPDYFLRCHNISDRNGNLTTFRLLHYPPIQVEPNDEIIRIDEHTDYGTCTLLMQDSEGGLEVKSMDGIWRRVGEFPGGILVNSADMLDIWTSGELKAAVHRVVIPKEKVIRSRTRYSMAFFVQPDNDTIVKPLNPPPGVEIKEISAIKYVHQRIDQSKPNE